MIINEEKEMEWKDITSYSRGDTEKIPLWWKAEIKHIRLTVGNYHTYYPDKKTWLMHCKPWYDTHILKANNLEDAKKEALGLVTQILNDVLNQVNNKYK